MKQNSRTNLKVGVTILVAIFALIYIVVWAKNMNISTNYYKIKIRFNNVAGLEKGDNISINGVKYGKVRDIILQGGYVFVEGEIPKEILLKDDAIATVEMMDLMGGKKIEIYPGTSPTNFNYNQNILIGHQATDIQGALKFFGDTENDLKIIVKDIKSIMSSINENILDKKFIEKINSLTNNFTQISEELKAFIKSNKTDIGDIIGNTKNITKNINDFSEDNISKISRIITISDSLVLNLNQMTNSINEIVSDTKSGNNNIGKVINDKEFFDKLKNSLDKVDKIVTVLNKQIDSTGIRVEAKIKF